MSTVAGPPGAPLRPWRADDVPAYREWLRPHHDWHRWDGPYFARPTDAEADAAAATLEGVVAEHGGLPPSERGLPPRRLVIADAGTDALVGTVSWHWESRETAWARMGVTVFDPAQRGRSVGRGALAAWTSYLFAHTDWVRLDYSTWSGNAAMLRVGEVLGFTEEARFRQARVVDGVRYDSVVMGVLRDEWVARPV